MTITTNEHAHVAQYVGRHQYQDINLFDALCLVQERCPRGWVADALTAHHPQLLSDESIAIGILHQYGRDITLYVVRYNMPRPTIRAIG